MEPINESPVTETPAPVDPISGSAVNDLSTPPAQASIAPGQPEPSPPYYMDRADTRRNKYQITAPDSMFDKVGGNSIENHGLKLMFQRAGHAKLGKGPEARIIDTPDIRTHEIVVTHEVAWSLEHDGYELDPSPLKMDLDSHRAAEAEKESSAAKAKADREAQHATDLKVAEKTLSGSGGAKSNKK